jgi:hypothetical protein
MFTARYALSPYIKQIRFVFKGLILYLLQVGLTTLDICGHRRVKIKIQQIHILYPHFLQRRYSIYDNMLNKNYS